ncbi:GntR family transcriptional regulator [Streptomyces flaveolus]|uniref:GntR family transcriptional regulator n=1 Tax=Streptomyces flaveolus TaxID=67297 RepID=UPI0033A60D80
MPTETIDLLDHEVAFLNLKQEAQASRIYRGLREAILGGAIPPATTMQVADLSDGYKAEVHVVRAALAGLAREGLTTASAPSVRVIAATVRLPTEGPAQHIERIMRQRLADRIYPAGSLLPPYDELAHDLCVPQKVLHRALEPLLAERLLSHSYRPLGVRVRPRATRREPAAPPGGRLVPANR